MADRAILYARVSTGDKDTEASKLGAQLELCRKRAEQEAYYEGQINGRSLEIVD